MVQYYDLLIGRIGIVEKEGFITRILLGNEVALYEDSVEDSPLLKETARQIEAFFQGRLKTFDLPTNPQGTEFMQEVWKALIEIPYGERRSYKEVAISLGRNKAYRAVGMANNKNPIPIIIPCHRVVGANGRLIGYRGGLELKETLLAIEKSNRFHMI